MVGIAVAGAAAASVAGSAIQGSAAGSAASAQAGAAMQAAQLQEQQYQQTRSDLQPYNLAGQAGLPALQAQAGNTTNALNTAYNAAQAQLPGPMTQAQLVQTPGYQFNLSQGLQATQAAAAARGLGVSGTALKQAGTFATGLANSTYSQQLANQNTIYGAYNSQFSNAYNQQNAIYNQMLGPAQLGEDAAAKAGAVGQLGAQAAGTNIANAGAATAAGITQGAAAAAQGLNSLGSSGVNYLAMNNLLTNGAGSGGSAFVDSGVWDV